MSNGVGISIYKGEMLVNYEIENLMKRVSEKIVEHENVDDFFEQGSVTEFMNKDGKEVIRNIMLDILKDDEKLALSESRKVLAEKHAYMGLNKFTDINSEEHKEYNKKINELQSVYEKSNKKLRYVEDLIYKLFRK